MIEQCEEIENGISRGESKIAYDTLKKITKPQQNIANHNKSIAKHSENITRT